MSRKGSKSKPRAAAASKSAERIIARALVVVGPILFILLFSQILLRPVIWDNGVKALAKVTDKRTIPGLVTRYEIRIEWDSGGQHYVQPYAMQPFEFNLVETGNFIAARFFPEHPQYVTLQFHRKYSPLFSVGFLVLVGGVLSFYIYVFYGDRVRTFVQTSAKRWKISVPSLEWALVISAICFSLFLVYWIEWFMAWDY